MPTANKKAGRPKTGRIRTMVRFTEAERKRLNLLRKSKPRGVYLGKLIMEQPLNPFEAFKVLKR